MYTRSFYKEDGGILLPENYDGVALREESENLQNEQVEKSENAAEQRSESESVFNLFKGNFPKNIFSGNGLFKSFRLGLEEILILGVAAFLFFTKEGDKECAIMLLALLFIT